MLAKSFRNDMQLERHPDSPQSQLQADWGRIGGNLWVFLHKGT